MELCLIIPYLPLEYNNGGNNAVPFYFCDQGELLMTHPNSIITNYKIESFWEKIDCFKNMFFQQNDLRKLLGLPRAWKVF